MRNWQRSAGFLSGPLGWSLSTELGQILPHVECGTSIPTSGLISVAAMVLSLIGAHLSWRVSRTRAAVDSHYMEGRVSMHFLDQLGALVGLTFAFALALQSAAAFIVSPCEQ